MEELSTLLFSPDINKYLIANFLFMFNCNIHCKFLLRFMYKPLLINITISVPEICKFVIAQHF